MSPDIQPSEPEPQSPGLPIILGIVLMLCAAWMMISRGSLDGVFHFDDYGNIVDNHRVRSLWPLDEFLTNNRPVGLYSFAVNYHFSGVDPSHQLRSLCFPLLSVVRSIARGLGMTAGIFAKDSTRSGCVMAQEDSAAENTGSPRPKVVS